MAPLRYLARLIVGIARLNPRHNLASGAPAETRTRAHGLGNVSASLVIAKCLITLVQRNPQSVPKCKVSYNLS